MSIEDKLNRKVVWNSDINEHLLAMRDLSKECNHITEIGVRKIVSTWAFLGGLKAGGKLVSIDIEHPSFYGADIGEVEKEAKDAGIEFEFIQGDSTAIKIEKTDLLFLDTIHTYEQVKKELALHAPKTRKYIVFHDTESCPEIVPAIDEMLAKKTWKLKEKYTHNNGLTIIERC